MFADSIWTTENTAERRRVVAEVLIRNGNTPIHNHELAYRVGLAANDFVPEDCLKDNTTFHGTRYRRLLSDDITALNRDMNFPYVILSDTLGVRLCTKEEAQHLFAMERMEALKKLAKCSVIAKKGALNDQVGIDLAEVELFIRSSYVAAS